MNYVNKKNSLRDLTDDVFDNIVSELAGELEGVGFIYDNYMEAELRKDWVSLCKKIPKEEFNASATTVVGTKLSKHFMRHFYDVKNFKGISVSSLWTKKNLEHALRFNRKYHTTPYVSELVRSLSFTNGLGKITMYRPVMAKMIVKHFNAKSVLDVCAGWGGRMLGSSCVDGVEYTGIEPCEKTYIALSNIKNFLKLDKVTLVNKPAEIALLEDIAEDKKYDIGLTSPPYYNLEIYSEEPSQSVYHKTYEEWVRDFLEPVVLGVIKRVKYSCWSVKNFKTEKQYNLLDEVIRIHEANGWMLMDEQFKVSNSKRPGKKNRTEENKDTGNEESEQRPKVSKTEEVTYVFCKA